MKLMKDRLINDIYDNFKRFGDSKEPEIRE